MKITLDTNILISATFWYGASFKIIKMIEEKKLELVLSSSIIEEFEEVLNYDEIKAKIDIKKLEIRIATTKIKELATIISPSRRVIVIKGDPDDNMILECGADGIVDYIITKDNHLLKLKEYEEIPIVTPEEFLKKITI